MKSLGILPFMETQIRHTLTKVPEITIFFWVVKILTTAFGESTSDYLVQLINPVIAVGIGALALVVALVWQFRAKHYNPWLYWFTVSMVAVCGTMAADVLHIGLGIPYLVSTIFFAIVLIIIFALWYVVENTLSIHSIYTRRREIFYWATVMTTFALGTAAGDMTAVTLNLGYFESGILFAALLAAITFAHYLFKASLRLEHAHQSKNAVLAFWLAYILTRPLGASFADWAGKAHSVGGLGLGDGTVSLALAILIIGFVSNLAITHKDTES
jgi:uncharacterized membrane-anchored protein